MANGAVVEGLPTWLKPALFLQADFDAEEYVSYLRRFVSAPQYHSMVHVCQGVCTVAHTNDSPCDGQVPLETLSTELQRYVTVLKGKLVEVINEDYNDFVSLSTKLVNVDGAVTQMQKPLLMLKVHMPRFGTIQRPIQANLKTAAIHAYTVFMAHAHTIFLVVCCQLMVGYMQAVNAHVCCTGKAVSCTRSRPGRADCSQSGLAKKAAGSESQSSVGAHARYSTCHVQGKACMVLSSCCSASSLLLEVLPPL